MTQLFFAEVAQPSAKEIGIWLQVASFILSIGTMIVLLVTMNQKQKREVNFAANPVEKEDFEKHKVENRAEHENIFSKLGGVERGVEARLMSRLDKLSEEDRRSRRDMHEQVTRIGNEVAGLQTSADLTNQRIVQMDSKLDRVIEGKHR